MRLLVTLDKPTHGYWDGGAKQEFEFSAEVLGLRGGYNTPHPGPGRQVRWGSWDANFWFVVASGRTWKESVSIARRWIGRNCRWPVASVEVVV